MKFVPEALDVGAGLSGGGRREPAVGLVAGVSAVVSLLVG
jgi:hypothetical protein